LESFRTSTVYSAPFPIFASHRPSKDALFLISLSYRMFSCSSIRFSRKEATDVYCSLKVLRRPDIVATDLSFCPFRSPRGYLPSLVFFPVNLLRPRFLVLRSSSRPLNPTTYPAVFSPRPSVFFLDKGSLPNFPFHLDKSVRATSFVLIFPRLARIFRMAILFSACSFQHLVHLLLIVCLLVLGALILPGMRLGNCSGLFNNSSTSSLNTFPRVLRDLALPEPLAATSAPHFSQSAEDRRYLYFDPPTH